MRRAPPPPNPFTYSLTRGRFSLAGACLESACIACIARSHQCVSGATTTPLDVRPTQDRCTACSRQPTPSKPRLSVWLGLNTVIRCLHRLSAAAGRVRAALQRGCSLPPHRMEARQGGAPSLDAAPLAMLARSAGAQEPEGDAPGALLSGAEVAPVAGQGAQRLPCLDATHPRGCSTCGPPARHHGSSGVDAAAAMARDTRGCVLAGSLTRRGFAASQVLPAPVTRLGSAVRASGRLWP